MSQAIISAGAQLAAGRSHSVMTPTFTSNLNTLTFTPHHTGNSSLRRNSRRPVTPVRASATAAAERSSIYVTTDSFYDLLGIPTTVTAPEIKQAYRKLARKYHPDVSPPEKAEEFTKQFLRVQEAYETLSDPRSRAEYDRDLASGFHLGFSARKQFDKGMDPKGEWRQRWESQVDELERMQQWKQRNRRSRRSSNDFSFN
ncbi:Chaperone protein dnaJ 20, chloroplastic [Linum grandiflorum]